MFEDTIAAIASPHGAGGIALIRVSGRDAVRVVAACFRPAGRDRASILQAASHTIHYGHIVLEGRRIDEVLVGVMLAPRTFTKEDVAEITCHGGLLAAKSVLDAVLASGARLAHAGEFTRRAFLNGRIDLAQAEAVADLIQSRTELALKAANEQLEGKLSVRINQLREELLTTLAHVEAHIDFPEEDLDLDTRGQLVSRLQGAISRMDNLLQTANEGRVLRSGIRAAIIGRPNAGKSSLLNQLLGHERAIVSDQPGTTRDTIEETANIRGLPVIFIDTAGLREAGNKIELEGIRRSRQSFERAEIILHVLDTSEPVQPADLAYLAEFAGKKRILILNKADLPIRMAVSNLRSPGSAGDVSGAGGPGDQMLAVSCVTGQGVEDLKDAIKNLVWGGGIGAEMLEVMINSRHQDALNRARIAASNALGALQGDKPLEVVALDLRIAVNAAGEIIGKSFTDDLLDRIFSQFCIGK